VSGDFGNRIDSVGGSLTCPPERKFAPFIEQGKHLLRTSMFAFAISSTV